jgi:guanylate kinase
MAMLVSEIKGHLILMMAPTGSGKGSLVSHVQKVFPQITHTVSCTTREKRPHEVEGVHYYFISREEFERRVSCRDFVEWAEYGGNLYGTLRTELTDRLYRGEVVICEIEVQGVLQLLRLIPYQYRTVIYVDAGDWETLMKRALARAPMSDTELALRYERYLEELAHKGLADIVVYNRDGEIDDAKQHMEAIMRDIIENVQK